MECLSAKTLVRSVAMILFIFSISFFTRSTSAHVEYINPQTLTSEDQIKSILQQTIMEYIYPDQFERLELQKYEGTDKRKEGKYVVTLYLQTYKGKTTRDSMRYVLKEIKNTGKAIFTIGNHKITDIIFCINGKIQDPYGNINDGLWFQVEIPEEDIYKVKDYNLALPDFARLIQIQYATKDARKLFSEIKIE